MIYKDLYDKVLVKPCEEGADTLKIISGYATSAMASDHLEDLHKKHLNAHISLLVGMCSSDGLSLSNHHGFQSLVSSKVDIFKNHFSCSYIYKRPPIHSKLYVWYRNKQLYKAFIGSANYTQNAFYHQREILAETHDANIDEYCQIVEKESIFCNQLEAEELICIQNDGNYYRGHLHEDHHSKNISETPEAENIIVSLLSSDGEVQRRGGLNWGQRPGREPNQAYIQLPPNVYKSDFFPKAPQHFIVVTDDSKSFVCRRAEKSKEGQTIHTPLNNSLLGEYFRNRIGVSNGSPVWRTNLEHYGRTDVAFYKFSDEEYYMDFHV
jgi:viroplasmin and RNaseH domain-containing protein